MYGVFFGEHVVLWYWCIFFFLMIRRPPRSTQSGSSAASDVYKRQSSLYGPLGVVFAILAWLALFARLLVYATTLNAVPVSYTHLRAHETVLDLVCRLLLEKKNQQN